MTIDLEENKNLIGIIGTTVCGAVANVYNNKRSKVPAEEVNSILDIANNILSKTNLKQKGVHIENFPNSRSAYYGTFSKTIGIDMKESGLSIFHEIGHAYMHNTNKISKFIPTTNKALILSMIAVSVPVAMETFSIGTNDMRDKAWTISPIIMGGVWLPKVIDEAVASIKGQKFAKPLLDKMLYKNVVKSNIAALLTYIFTGLGCVFLSKLEETNSSSQVL